jgi:hypothetical protein
VRFLRGWGTASVWPVMARAQLIANCLTISFAASVALAEEQHNYVSVSDAAFAALQCSVFAAHARYSSEEKRLFSYGLKQALLFIQAARSGLVSQEDFAHTNFVWPLALRVWNFEPQDASSDFVAGTVYEMIWESTTEQLGNQSQDKATYQEPARAEFSNHNCRY